MYGKAISGFPIMPTVYFTTGWPLRTPNEPRTPSETLVSFGLSSERSTPTESRR